MDTASVELKLADADSPRLSLTWNLSTIIANRELISLMPGDPLLTLDPLDCVSTTMRPFCSDITTPVAVIASAESANTDQVFMLSFAPDTNTCSAMVGLTSAFDEDNTPANTMLVLNGSIGTGRVHPQAFVTSTWAYASDSPNDATSRLSNGAHVFKLATGSGAATRMFDLTITLAGAPGSATPAGYTFMVTAITFTETTA